MQAFRSEHELLADANGKAIVAQDIIALERKIHDFKAGLIPDEKFRSLRLARGVYGQRQQGVQMIRIKLPYGKLTFKQLLRIADVSDEYSTGKLHLTTRQDIQIHHVSLERTPQLWAELEKDDVTLREACGNTVRNITASAEAGIDPNEPFDVSPYADAMFRYFLRNPICQEMGRKIKIAFSSSAHDSAVVYIHDLGFIPKLQEVNGILQRGFRVLIAGGLGAQPSLAQVVHEFLPEDQLIPYTESVLRVFDRHGERNNRNKARLKFLVNKIGLDAFIDLVAQEQAALKVKSFKIPVPQATVSPIIDTNNVIEPTSNLYKDWCNTNVFEQKQKGYYGVWVKVSLGDLSTKEARDFVAAISPYVADDVRVTINQGFLLKFVKGNDLPDLYQALDKIGFAKPGFNSVYDITACPGTDTCNLAISNSTQLTQVLEDLIENEYPELIYNKDIKIKISGCMNSCGQHGLAQIGFHGSSIKGPLGVAPALQVLLGGGTVGNGVGRVANKVLKVPSKRGPQVLANVLDDYQVGANSHESFNDYFDRKGEKYFYDLLKPLSDLSSLTASDYVDWGNQEKYATAIGVGECAGVMIDLVATLIFEAEEKIELAKASFLSTAYADSIYHSYSAQVNAAKALLMSKGIACNTQQGIITDFDANFSANEFSLNTNFSEAILSINKNEPSEDFAARYLLQAEGFIKSAKTIKANQSINETK